MSEPIARMIGGLLLKEDFQAFLVGGCVRDYLLGIPSNDYDIATNATPSELLEIAKKHKIIARDVGKSFGVILFVVDGVEYEIATFRSDGFYSDHRRPDSVSYADHIEDDLSRRDFTINAMAIDLSSGDLIDPFRGKLDLQKRVVRTVGDPRLRFNEDYLRIIRFFRFVSKFGFEPDAEAMEEIISNPSRVSEVAPERIRMELEKILMVPKPSIAFELMEQTGVLSYILPELDVLKVVPQGPPHDDSVWDHVMKVVDFSAMLGGDLTTRLAAVLHDIGKTNAFSIEEKIRFREHSRIGSELSKEILYRLKFSNDMIENVTDLINYHMTFHHITTKGIFRRYINRFGVEQTNRLLMLHMSDLLDSRLQPEDLSKIVRLDAVKIEAPAKRMLQVDGRDIIHYLEIPSGPLIGKIKTFMEYLLSEEVIPDSRDHQIEFLIGLRDSKIMAGV